MRKLVGTYVDKVVGSLWVSRAYLTGATATVQKTTFCTQFLRTFSQSLYTRFITILHLFVGLFSPVSTSPTISTLLDKKLFSNMLGWRPS